MRNGNISCRPYWLLRTTIAPSSKSGSRRRGRTASRAGTSTVSCGSAILRFPESAHLLTIATWTGRLLSVAWTGHLRALQWLLPSHILAQKYHEDHSGEGHAYMQGLRCECARAGRAYAAPHRSKSLSESSPFFFVILVPLRIPLRLPPPTNVCPSPPLASLSWSWSSSLSGRVGRPSPTVALPSFERGAAASDRDANCAEAADVS